PPADRQRAPGERSRATRLRRAEDEDPVRLRRSARLVAPELRHLPMRSDLVDDEPGERIALRPCCLVPHPLGEAVPAADDASSVELDVADDEDDHGVV